jgi:hypothetical protein
MISSTSTGFDDDSVETDLKLRQAQANGDGDYEEDGFSAGGVLVLEAFSY